MHKCKVCGCELYDKTDDYYNRDHTILFCPRCEHPHNVDELEKEELRELLEKGE